MVVLKLMLLIFVEFATAAPSLKKSTVATCITSDNDHGNCVPLMSCPKLMEKLEKLDSTQKHELIRNDSCYRPTREHVCCSEEFESLKRLNFPEYCGDIFEQKSISGREIVIHSRPWLALLMYEEYPGTYKNLCGGSLITKRFILTAAHCVIDDQRPIKQIRLGEHHLDQLNYTRRHRTEKGHENFAVKDIIVHNKFNISGNGENDIALVKLDGNVKMKEHIIPICLPTSPELRNISKTMNEFLIAGWGLTENNTYSVVPLEINAFRTNCSLYAPSNSICVSGDRNDTCNGDSGNALIYAVDYYNSQRLVQFGIVSRGSQECNSGVPSINTNVIDYLPWINKKLVM